MDIVETLRVNPEHIALRDQAADEIERLRVENELFRRALKSADQAIAAAPIWHVQHRVLSEVSGIPSGVRYAAITGRGCTWITYSGC